MEAYTFTPFRFVFQLQKRFLVKWSLWVPHLGDVTVPANIQSPAAITVQTAPCFPGSLSQLDLSAYFSITVLISESFLMILLSLHLPLLLLKCSCCIWSSFGTLVKELSFSSNLPDHLPFFFSPFASFSESVLFSH